ncbi:hypothetical protein AB0D57_45670 [Streptomyces sp. NPDC048275]|uniref:hypothetical protein n=1 Tax=Streptomyces sp. NPDC048275 TaxID=3155629 RepID=UPI0033EF3FCA
MTAGWCSRTVRAAVFAVVCVLLAALGHVMMSGGVVPWWALGGSGVVIGGMGWCLAGRERGLPLIVSSVVAAQVALHSAFSLAQSSGSSGAWGAAVAVFTGADTLSLRSLLTGFTGHGVSSMSMGAAHMDSAHMGAMDMGSMDPMGHTAGGGSSSLGMLAAHLLAALLCGLWLAHGERAAFRVLRVLASRLAAPLRLLLALPAPAHRPRLRVCRNRSVRAPRRFLLVHAITSRGPPAGTAVV